MRDSATRDIIYHMSRLLNGVKVRPSLMHEYCFAPAVQPQCLCAPAGCVAPRCSHQSPLPTPGRLLKVSCGKHWMPPPGLHPHFWPRALPMKPQYESERATSTELQARTQKYDAILETPLMKSFTKNVLVSTVSCTVCRVDNVEAEMDMQFKRKLCPCDLFFRVTSFIRYSP